MSLIRPGRTFAAAGAVALVLATVPAAMAAHSTVSERISHPKTRADNPPTVTIGFTIARENDEKATLRQIVLDLPSSLVAYGKRYPSCTPGKINANHSFSDCRPGSRLGAGRFVADVPAAGVYDVPGSVLMFNGKGGRSITVHFFMDNPVPVDLAFSAPLRRTHGRYGYRLTADFPHALQELRPGWFAEIKSFEASFRSLWKGQAYFEARTCPAGGSAPIAGTFSFLEQAAPTSAVGSFTCRP
jgi:hypothetical protein